VPITVCIIVVIAQRFRRRVYIQAFCFLLFVLLCYLKASDLTGELF